MPLVHCSDHLISVELSSLISLLESNGAWFHPDLVIVADSNGNICVKSASGQSDRRSFVRMPLALMPFQDDFSFTVLHEDLVSAPVSGDIDPLHVQIMEQMINIYNACGKISQWKESSPLTALSSWPDIHAFMFQAKAHAPKLQNYLDLRASGNIDQLLVDSFLGSRVFNLNPEVLKELGHDNATQGKTVLMPVIDYFNHRFQAEGYSVQTSPSPPSMRVFGVPDPKTREVSVRYNLYDPMDTFLFYGFVDTLSPWLASIPMSLDLPDGRRLTVLNTGGAVKKQLPPAVKDLRLYLPIVQDPDKEEIKINKLLIPGPGAPRALQRVLAGLLQSLCKDLDRQELLQWVGKLEIAILDINRQWWRNLAEKTDALPEDIGIAKELRTLCTFGQNHLTRYVNQRKRMAAKGVTGA